MDRFNTARRLVAAGLLLGIAATSLAQDSAPGREPRCVKTSSAQCTEWASPPLGYTWDDVKAAQRQMADRAATPTPPAVPANDPGVAFYSATLDAEAECERGGGDRMNCYVEASPRRCKQTAVSLVGNPSEFLRTWTMCVRSCGTANVWSRTLGDCRR